MVKVECPNYKPDLGWDFGIKLGEYYFLVDNREHKLIKISIDTDAVIMICTESNSYKFYDKDLTELSDFEYEIIDKIDLPNAVNGHQISKTDLNLLITSWQEYDEPYPVGVQLIDRELEEVNSYNWHQMDGVAWSIRNRRIFVLAYWLIFLFDENLEEIKAEGVTSVDDSSCIVKDDYLWTADYGDETVRKRNINDVKDVTVEISNSYGMEQKILDYGENILIVNSVPSSIANTNFILIDPMNGQILLKTTFLFENLKQVIVGDTYSYFIKENGDLIKLDEEFIIKTTKSENVRGIIWLD